jgi:hypothetical protein
VKILMYAEGNVRQLSKTADAEVAFHSFIALCARKQLGHQQECEDQKEREGGKVRIQDI